MSEMGERQALVVTGGDVREGDVLGSGGDAITVRMVTRMGPHIRLMTTRSTLVLARRSRYTVYRQVSS